MVSHLNGEREGGSPGGNLLAQLQDVRDGLGGNLGLEVLELVGLLGERTLNILADLDGLVDVVSDALEVLLTHTTGGHGRSTDTDTTGGKGRLVTRDGVLVASNVDLLQDSLNTSTVQLLSTEVDQDHVAVSAVRDELVAQLLELVLQSLGVVQDLLLVLLELGSVNLLESNSKGSDGVVVGTTLVTRENGEVDRTLKVVKNLLSGLVSAAHTLAEEDHGTTGATKRLVGGGSDNIGVLEGRRNDTGGDQSGDMGHINDEVSADLVSDLAHALIVDQAAVGGGTGNQTLGAVELSVGLQGIVINDTSLKVDTVGEGLEVSRDSRDPERFRVSNGEDETTARQCETYFLAGV